MTVEAIKDAIAALPAEDVTALTSWLLERDWDLWDEQIERDFAAGGRGVPWLENVKSEIAEGKTRPLEEILAERRKSSG